LFSKFNQENKQGFMKLFIQFFKFGIVGLSNNIIYLGIYYIFIFIDHHLYIVGNTTGFVVSVLNAYYWNSKYVFKKQEKRHIRLILKSFGVYGLTFLLGTGLMYLMVEFMGISKVIAPIINLSVTIPLNFLLNKFWTFR